MKPEAITDPRLGLPSASSFAADVECPGRQQLIATLPDDVVDLPDEDSLAGDRKHDAWSKNDPSNLKEDELSDYEKGLKHAQNLVQQWSEEQLEFAQECPRELRLWYNDKSLAPVLSGQLDRHWLTRNAVLVLDWKSGWSTYVPAARKSWQLRVYAILAWKEYLGIETVRVAFVKPKLKAEPIDYCDYTAQDLEQSEAAMLYHLWASKQEDAPRIAGSHCRYCPCAKAGVCPEAGAYRMLPSAITRINGSASTVEIEERVNALAPNDLVKIWESKAVINAIMDAVQLRLKSMPDEALAALGLGRDKGRRLDPIVQTKAAYDRVLREGVPEEQAWNLLSMSKTELVLELRRQFGWSEQQCRGWIKGQLGLFIEEKTSEAPLVKL